MSDLKMQRDRILEEIIGDSTISDEEFKELSSEEQMMYSAIGGIIQYRSIKTLLEDNEGQCNIISLHEYNELTDEEKQNFIEDKTEKKYRRTLQIPPDEFDSFLILKSYESHRVIEKAFIESSNTQKEVLKSISTIKNIVVFIFVLSIIASILLLLIQVQRF